MFISQLIRYARACSSYECFILRARRLSSKLLKQGYLVERLKSSFRKFYGRYGDLIEQYGVTLSRMLNDILTLTNSDFPTDQTFHQFHDLYTELDLHRSMSGFHGAFATGVASQQGTLTLPDTWFRSPFWDLLMLQLLRPNSSNLPCLYSTFHLEYPLVLSRFCIPPFEDGGYIALQVWVACLVCQSPTTTCETDNSKTLHLINFILITLYNYRLLMRSTRYHVDRVRYWLTDAVGGG